MQWDVLKIKGWCDVNKLTINVKKTKLILYNVKPEQRLVLPNICLDQDEIELVWLYKYLGITIDQDLNLYSHVDLMYRMASDKLYMLRYIDTETCN